MDTEDPLSWFDQPPVPLEQLHQQALKNRDYALAALASLPDKDAKPLRDELTELMQGTTAAYEAGNAAEHYRLDRQFSFQFMMQLNFTLQANS